jgi:hypothetical protein
MKSDNNSLLTLAGLGLAAVILTQGASAETPPECTDTTWICDTNDRLEHSNCENTRTTTPCSLASDAAEMIAGHIPVDLRYDVNDDGIVDSSDVILLKIGTPLRALHPANITATIFPVPTIPSGTYNTVAIDITWTNLGEQPGPFVPQVQIGSDTPIDLSIERTLDSGATYSRSTTLNDVPSGTQTICPLPNTVVSCQTIDVPTLTTVCYKGVTINMTPCPWDFGVGKNFWVQAVPVGETWTYQNCYDTLEATKAAIDALTTYTFNQC